MKKLEIYNINITYDENMYEFILSKVKDTFYGARPLRRIIQTELEDKITDEIINGNIIEGKEIKLTVENNQIKYLLS